MTIDLSCGLDLELWPSLRSRSNRSNLLPLDLDLRLFCGSRFNLLPLDLDLRLFCGSRSNPWPLDLDPWIRSRAVGRALDLDLTAAD